MRETIVTKKRALHFPHVLSLVFILIIGVAIATWIIPSGSFAREKVQTSIGERTVAVAGSYEMVEKVSEGGDLRQGIADVLMAPVCGMQAAAQVVCFVLIVGGAFGIIEASGAITSGLSALIRKLGKRDYLLIPIVLTLFSIAGSTNGMGEEAIPFFAIFMTLCLQIGYDSFTGFFIVLMGCRVGCIAGTINPFSVIVAQGIAGIEGNPQLGFRLIVWVLYTAMMIIWVMMYAAKVKKDPTKSLCYEHDQAKRAALLANASGIDSAEFTMAQKLICAAYLIGIVVMIIGLMAWGWYMDELCAVFLFLGLFAGIVSRMGEKKMAECFLVGMKDFMFTAAVIGIAKGILVVAEDGMILDTILNALVNLLQGMPFALFVVLFYIVMTLFGFLVPSSSGFAALTIPIVAPMMDLMGLNPEAAVTALTHACGMACVISPTGSILVAGLSICGCTLPQYWKTTWKFWTLMGIFSCVIIGISALL